MKTFGAISAATVVAAFIMGSAPAKASLVELTDVQLSGQGVGHVTTVLSLQSPGSDTIETGGVNFNGSTFGTGISPGANKNQTFTFAQLGITNANQLGLVVNLNEPNNETPPSVGPYSITLTAFSSTGTTLGTFTGSGNQLLQVAGGVGGSGIVFGLDAAQAGILNGLNPLNDVFAVSATFQGAEGGIDVIQAASLTSVAAVPEPATWAMMVLGFAGVGMMAYRKRRPEPIRIS